MEAEENHTNEVTLSSSFQQKESGDDSGHDLDDLHIHANGGNLTRNTKSFDSEHAGDNEVEQQVNGDNLDYDWDESNEYGMHEDGDTAKSLDKEGAGDNEVVILVVSDEKQNKDGIVDALTRNDRADWREEFTLSGTRTLTRTSPARVVVDTTPLQCTPGKSPSAIARRWISHNSLRRAIVHKYVVVVCVITCSILDEPCNSSIFGYDNCWVDVLRILFKTHKGGVLTVVSAYNDTIDDRKKERFRRFVRDHKLERKNIIYSSTSSGGDDVAQILEESVGMEAIISSRRSSSVRESFRLRESFRMLRAPKEVLECTNISNTGSLIIKPQFMKEVFSRRDNFTVWDAERVILLGRTGSGKSTLAQMLTTGNLEPGATIFSYGSGIRGHTKAIQCGQGRGWLVVDTPGFGEPNNGESTISTEEAQGKIKRFVEMKDGVFAHYIFVLKKDRIDQLEFNLWNFFKHLFGEDLKRHFSIVISNADKEWIDGNMDSLKRGFEGCESFLCAEFPSTWRDMNQEVQVNEDLKAEQAELRAEEEWIQRESLGKLEDELALLERCDRPCDYGQYSRMNKVMERERSNSDMRLERSLRTKMIVQGSAVMFQLDELSCRLMHFFTINDELVVPPLNLT